MVFLCCSKTLTKKLVEYPLWETLTSVCICPSDTSHWAYLWLFQEGRIRAINNWQRWQEDKAIRRGLNGTVTGKSLSLLSTCCVSLVKYVFWVKSNCVHLFNWWRVHVFKFYLDKSKERKRHCLNVCMAMGMGVNMSNIKLTEFLEARQK